MRPTTRIIRSRTGCFTCRRRKKKCNEEKPVCSGCRRNQLDCRWPADITSTPNVHVRSFSAGSLASQSIAVLNLEEFQQKYRKVEPKPDQISYGQDEDADVVLPDDTEVEIEGVTEGQAADAASQASDGVLLSLSPAEDTISSPSLDIERRALPDQLLSDETTSVLSSSLSFGIPMSMSLLPSHDHNSFELLSYYLTRTANSMGNGSTEINPFIAKLVPLAFSHPLVLQLILAQSAAHRQSSNDRMSNNEIAQRYYTDSVRMFRQELGGYVAGRDGNMLVLTVGSLIMCLTEVARGDKFGTIFDHLTASRSFLAMLLNSAHANLGDELPDFLIEYYMHMAASSMISTDARQTSEPFVSTEIEALAMNLKAKKYVGQLCGSWFDMLVLIPQIFQLGQRMLHAVDDNTTSLCADDIITFGLLQSQTLAFIPDPTLSPESYLAGMVFKQAVLLYLWSILGTPQQSGVSNSHKALMDSAVSEAVSLLSQFPASVRVNTSLCWPLAVIGCCTSDPAVQDILRIRLQTMVETIGLGNMRETLVLLEHVWRQPVEETSPWTLCKTMQEHQTWISFA